MSKGVYRNTNPVMNLHGVPIYMKDVVDACLTGRLNLFLQGDTGSGKTQLARDAMSQFGDKSIFLLGRNDMQTRELFEQINLEKLKTAKTSAELKELTDKLDANLIVVDELPNCVPAVRAQLFNLFDGFVESSGRMHPIGNGYSVGIATGNIGQKFTESANDMGRALLDRMHVILDTDHFAPTPYDTMEILSGSTNPRVEVTQTEDLADKVIKAHNELVASTIPFEKQIVAGYLVNGLDYCSKGSKRKMKDAWPNALDKHEEGGDEHLVLPISIRGAKSVLRLSQALDKIAIEKGATKIDPLESMLQAYKIVAAYSGVLNEADVIETYNGDKYAAIDAINATTRTQFSQYSEAIRAGLEGIRTGKLAQKVLDKFSGRWGYMKQILTEWHNQNDEKSS